MLLHIGDTLVPRTFDPWVAVLAAAMFAGVALVIWTPRRGRRRAARRLASYGVALVVFLALLPTILPYDHLLSPTGMHGETAQVHQDHCHGSPGSCSDAPVTSGAGQFLTSDPVLPAPALAAFLMVTILPMLVGIGFRPVLRPPAASFAMI